MRLIRGAIILLAFFGVSVVHGQQSAAFYDVAREYREARDLYDQQKYNLAYQQFRSFIDSYEEEDDAQSRLLLADAYYYLASCASKQKDPRTEDYYRDYLVEHKGHSLTNMAYFDLGNYYFDSRSYNAALDYYDKVNEKALNKNFYEEYAFKRGFCHFSRKDFETARLSWTDITRQPGSTYYYDANYYSGMAAYYETDYPAAAELFEIAGKDLRYRNLVPYYVAQIRFIDNDYQGVIDYAVPQLERSGVRNKSDIQQLVGQSYFELDQYDEAITYLHQYTSTAASVTKEDYYQLGYAQYKQGDHAGAVENFKQLNHLNNALAQNALYHTGLAYLQLGDKENARTALKRSGSMDYDLAITEESRFNYAKLSYELGFTNDAMLSIRKFLDDYPQSYYITEANEILADILLQTNNYDEALLIIEQMNNPSPKIQGAYQLMAYHKGISRYNEGRLNQALEALKKSLRYTPDRSISSLTRYWMGDIYHRKGNYQASINNTSQFLASTAKLDEDYTEKVSKGTGQYLQGYNQYKLQEYEQAIRHFEQAARLLPGSTTPELINQLLPDALLRAADCHFLTRNYTKAVSFYDQVIDKAYEGADYALYQKAIVRGIGGQQSEKISLLDQLVSSYPNSVLADDATFETGNTYIALDKDTEAIQKFRKVIQVYPESEWVAPAYLKIGLIRFNDDEYDDALTQYKTVVREFPGTGSAAEALLAIRDVYIAMGDPSGYIDFLEEVPGSEVTMSEQDSVLYLSAENLFAKGEYEKALQGFDDYLLRFPSGYFSLPAHYYRGECHFSFQDFASALPDYETIISKPRNRFTERSLQRSASINFYHMKAYAKADDQYRELLQIASTEDNRMASILGILRCSFQLKDYRSSIEYAGRVLGDVSYTEFQQTEAYFYRARAYWQLNDQSRAIEDYRQVMDRVTNEWAAEGAYHIALDHYRDGRLDQAEEACFSFTKTYPAYASWLVRTYVLLADIYISRDNLFQARATIQSVLDNYTVDDEWRAMAVAKFEEIEALEEDRSKIDKNRTVKPNNVIHFED